MGKRKAIRIIFQEDPIETGREYPVVFEFRIRDRIELLDVGGCFEGICRCTVNGQDTVQSVINVPLDLTQLKVHLIPHKGKLMLPSGVYRIPGVLNIASDTPGSIRGKHGALAYRFRVYLRARKNDEEATLDNEREVDVIGSVSMDRMPEFEKPISLNRKIKRKFLCFNILEADVKIELEKAAFMPGEHVLVMGEISNEVHSSNLRQVSIELRQKTLYKSGDGSRNENHTIRRVMCGDCTSGQSLKIHRSLSVPVDLYPSLSASNSAIQVGYEVVIQCLGYFHIDIPVFIGNRKAMSSRPSPIHHSSSQSSLDSFEKSSFCSSSLHSDPYYYYPIEGFNERPPPYPGRSASPYFIPIQVQPRVFQPVFQVPFREFPPEYSSSTHGSFVGNDFSLHSPTLPSSHCNQERFLKIEEII